VILRVGLCSSRIFVGGVFSLGWWVDVFVDCCLSLLFVVWDCCCGWFVGSLPSGLCGVVDMVVVAPFKTTRSA